MKTAEELKKLVDRNENMTFLAEILSNPTVLLKNIVVESNKGELIYSLFRYICRFANPALFNVVMSDVIFPMQENNLELFKQLAALPIPEYGRPESLINCYFSYLSEGNRDKIATLFRLGLDPNATNELGKSAVEVVEQAKEFELAKWLKDKCDEEKAVASESSLLHDAKNHSNKEGEVPLLLALKEKKIETAKQLIYTFKADVNVSDTKGMSALMYASRINDEILFRVVMNQSDPEKINLTDQSGNTALHHAIKANADMCAEILLRNQKVNPFLKNIYDQTAEDILEENYSSIESIADNIYQKIKLKFMERKSSQQEERIALQERKNEMLEQRFTEYVNWTKKAFTAIANGQTINLEEIKLLPEPLLLEDSPRQSIKRGDFDDRSKSKRPLKKMKIKKKKLPNLSDKRVDSPDVSDSPSYDPSTYSQSGSRFMRQVGEKVSEGWDKLNNRFSPKTSSFSKK